MCISSFRGFGVNSTSTSPSAFTDMPNWPAAIRSALSVAYTTIVSVASPMFAVISISGMFDSVAKPGPKTPPRLSRMRRSLDPELPLTTIEFVFVVVAAPHATGLAPKWSAPLTTTNVASPPVAMVAVTTRVPASYVHDSTAAAAGPTSKPVRSAATASAPAAADFRIRRPPPIPR